MEINGDLLISDTSKTLSDVAQIKGITRTILYEGNQTPNSDGSAATVTLNDSIKNYDLILCLLGAKGASAAAPSQEDPSFTLFNPTFARGMNVRIWSNIPDGYNAVYGTYCSTNDPKHMVIRCFQATNWTKDGIALKQVIGFKFDA